jgi:hypothetical protein
MMSLTLRERQGVFTNLLSAGEDVFARAGNEDEKETDIEGGL